jgi:TP901 family phage tail tape measure protein
LSQKKLSALVEIGGAVQSSLGKAFSGLTRDVGKLDKTVGKLNKTVKDDAMGKQLKTLQKAHRAYTVAERKVKDLRLELQNSKRPTEALRREYERAKKDLDRYGRSVDAHSKRLKNLKHAQQGTMAGGAGSAVGGAVARRGMMGAAMGNAAMYLPGAGMAMGSGLSGKSLGVAVGAGVVGAGLVAATSAAIDFEDAMADVKKVLDVSDEQFAKLTSQILKTAPQLAEMPTELAASVAAAAQAGTSYNELLRTSEFATRSAIAFGTDIEETTKSMIGIKNSLALTQDEVESLFNSINYLGNTTNATESNIIDFMNEINNIGEMAGLSSKEVAAMGSALIGVNIPAKKAGNAVKRMLGILASGASATNEQKETFKALGFTSEQFARDMQTGAVPAIEKLFKALQKLPRDRQLATLKDLFGLEGQQSVAALASRLDNFEDALRKVNSEAANGNNVYKESEERLSTTASAFKKLGSSATRAGATIGSGYIKYLKYALNITSALLNSTSDLIELLNVKILKDPLGALGFLVPQEFKDIASSGSIKVKKPQGNKSTNVTVNAPVTINASTKLDAKEVKDTVKLAFKEISLQTQRRALFDG